MPLCLNVCCSDKQYNRLELWCSGLWLYTDFQSFEQEKINHFYTIHIKTSALIIQRWLKYFTLMCNNQTKGTFSVSRVLMCKSIYIDERSLAASELLSVWQEWEENPFFPLFIDMNPMTVIVSAEVSTLMKGNWPQLCCFPFFSQHVSVMLMAPYLRSAVRRLASAGAKKMWLEESVISAW